MFVTKTTNQIHFEDLDPIRFEELILSVVYRMARWETIYHFGKKGSDDGIDISATEILENNKQRTHHFQCKKYKRLGITQLKKTIDEFTTKNSAMPDKYILVVACDLTKKSIDLFFSYAKSKGFQAVDVWTKSVIEARLYAEYHDLLFAYFGISLTKQRNDRIASVRRHISLKHKMHHDFIKQRSDRDTERERKLSFSMEKFKYKEILVRSIDDTSYPNNKLLPQGHYGYQNAPIYDFYYNGIAVFTYPYWQDIIVRKNHLHDDESGNNAEIETIRVAVIGYIPYNNIIDYDLDGDEFYMKPHVFCDYTNGDNPYEFFRYAIENERGYFVLDDDDIVEVVESSSHSKV